MAPEIVDEANDSQSSLEETMVSLDRADNIAIPAAPVPMQSVVVPAELTFSITGLIAGDETLHGYQHEQQLMIFQRQQPLLQIRKDGSMLHYQAWPGSERWGIIAEWGQSTASQQHCWQDEIMLCSFSESIEGGYIDKQLAFIRWSVRAE